MALMIVMSTEDFQIRWNALSLSFSERERGKWPLGLSDFYRNYFISNDCIQHSGKIPFANLIKVTPTTFSKLAKSHIPAQFFVRVFVLGWYIYFETAQVFFSLCFREKGVKTLKIYQ